MKTTHQQNSVVTSKPQPKAKVLRPPSEEHAASSAAEIQISAQVRLSRKTLRLVLACIVTILLVLLRMLQSRM